MQRITGVIKVYRGGELLCRARVADTFLSRLLGLMLRQRLPEDEGLLIKYSTRFRARGLHSFFMRFPIDLIFISSQGRVVETAALDPWRFYTPRKECSCVLEVRRGFLRDKRIALGETLRFEVEEGSEPCGEG